jgi:hypothetical protein
MTTAELLTEYKRLLRQKGPDSDAAYELMMNHLDEAEFIRLAEEARTGYVQHQKVVRLLLILAPIYVCLAAVFLLMVWFG